MLFLYNSFWEF